MYYEINEKQARQAKGMWSFSDYIEGSETRAYQKMVDEAYALCDGVPEERKERAMYYADMYARKLAENINKGFRIELMCPSVMICGPANFPVRKKEKQNAARDRNFADYERIQGILSKIKGQSNMSSAILMGDENALDALQEKVDKLEALQAHMKKANAHYRKHKTMNGFETLTDEQANEIDDKIKNDYWGCPYPAFELTNNNAKLKHAMQRLEQLKRAKAKPTSEIETEYFKVVENTEIMRLQLIFDGKPSAEIRSILKSRGFVWSGKNMAWQRQLTANARNSLEYVKKEIAALEAASVEA